MVCHVLRIYSSQRRRSSPPSCDDAGFSEIPSRRGGPSKISIGRLQSGIIMLIAWIRPSRQPYPHRTSHPRCRPCLSLPVYDKVTSLDERSALPTYYWFSRPHNQTALTPHIRNHTTTRNKRPSFSASWNQHPLVENRNTSPFQTGCAAVRCASTSAPSTICRLFIPCHFCGEPGRESRHPKLDGNRLASCVLLV